MMSRGWTTSPTAGITTSPRNVCPNAGVATLPDSVIGRLSLQLSGSGQLQLKGLEHIQTSIWYDKNIDRTNPVQEWPANLDPCWFFVPSSCLCWPFVFHGRPKKRAQTWKRKPWKRFMCRGSLGCSQWSSKEVIALGKWMNRQQNPRYPSQLWYSGFATTNLYQGVDAMFWVQQSVKSLPTWNRP